MKAKSSSKKSAPAARPAAAPAAPRARRPQPDAPEAVQSVPNGREMRRMIEEAAYFRALRRGFEPGFELDDWIAAEAEIQKNLERRL